MDILSAIADLYRHMEWADAALWDAIVKDPGPGMDRTVRERLLHVHMVQYGFLSVWGGMPPGAGAGKALPSLADFPDPASLCRWGRQYHQAVKETILHLDAARLDAPMVLPWAERTLAAMGLRSSATTFGETLFQVPMHSAHHRGQAAARFHESGGKPPTTDFIMWAWLGKPAPSWPA